MTKLQLTNVLRYFLSVAKLPMEILQLRCCHKVVKLTISKVFFFIMLAAMLGILLVV